MLEYLAARWSWKGTMTPQEAFKLAKETKRFARPLFWRAEHRGYFYEPVGRWMLYAPNKSYDIDEVLIDLLFEEWEVVTLDGL